MTTEVVKMSNHAGYKKNIFYWSLYDLGNTIYSLVIVSLTMVALTKYLLYTGGSGQDANTIGNYVFAFTLFFGNILMAIISPFLGALADHSANKKRLLLIFSGITMFFMASLTISSTLPQGEINSVLTIMFLFLIANLGYQMALIIYDSMLPFIAEKHHIGKASGFGIAIGYFGSIIGILLSFLLIPIYGDFAIEPGNTLSEVGVFTLGYIPYIYPLAAIMFLLFSLPLFLFVKEHQREIPKREFGIRKEVISQVKVTAGEIRKYKSMFWFLIGWLIFVDAANTVIAFMTDIVQVGLEFGESKIALIVLFLGVIFAVLGTYPIGMYVDRKGPRKGLLLVTLLWTSAILVAFFTNLQIGESRTPEFMVYLVGMLSGPAIGGTWVVQRQYVIELAPIQKIGNYFGFTNIFGRVSAAVGPLIWATSVYIFGLLNFNSNMSTRISILILGIIMILGFYIIYSKVEDVHDHFLNGARANGKGEWIDEDGNVVFKSN